MNATSVWPAGRPITRTLLASVAVAALGLGAVQTSPALAATPATPGNAAQDQAQGKLKPLEVSITRVDTNKTISVGTELRFTVTIRNPNPLSDYAGQFTAFPSASTISGVQFVQNGQPSCRMQRLEGQIEAVCASNNRGLNLVHRVTQEDLDRGHFDATATFEMSKDPLGKEKLAPSGSDSLRIEFSQNADPADPPVVVPVKGIRVVWNRTDELGDKVYVGDTLTWAVSITNVSGQNAVAFPRTANVDNALTPGAHNCRWGAFTVGKHYDCQVSHTVTAADLEKKVFTPEIAMDLTRDTGGNNVIISGELVKGAPVAISEGTRPPAPKIKDILARPGAHGFTCHRIPALTTAPNGWLLAAWDGRPDGCGDSPNPNSIIQWISKDGGATWEEADHRVVAAGKKGADKIGYSDPSYVVDRETGDIYMFFVKSFDTSFQGSQRGTAESNRRVLHAAVMKSSDNGLTWSDPKVITSAIQPEGDTNGQVWFSRFAASGEGIQKRYGPNKGRLIQQFTFKKEAGYYAVSVFSDDHGETWKAGNPVGPKMDENKVVELSDGRLLLNSRRSDQVKNRLVAVSSDGGVNWTDLKNEGSLRDPNNNASIIRAFPDAPQGSACAKVLLFSNAFNPNGRSNGTISASLDDGQNWKQVFTFEHGAMQYSTLTPLKAGDGSLNSGRYGLLYEANGPTITHRTLTFDQLNIDGTAKQELLDTCVAKVQMPPANPDVPPATEPQTPPPATEPQTPPATEPQTPPTDSPQQPPATEPQTPPTDSPQQPPATEPQTPPANPQQPPATDPGTGPGNTPQQPPADKPKDEKPSEEKPSEEKPSEEKPSDEKPSDEKPSDEKPQQPPVQPAPQPQPQPRPQPQPPVQPQPAPTPRVESVGSVSRVAGASRVETAVAIAKADFAEGSPVAILARADVHADSASAVPLAKHLNAPVLVSQPDVLHPMALEELKRLKAKKVVIMGGKVAISDGIEADLVKAGFKVERVAGENRAATAVATAKTLAKAGKAKQVLVADGADWQPSMIAGPAAAKVEGVTLLTNGKAQAPETAAYLAELKAKPIAVGEAAKAALNAQDAVSAATPSALSLAVAERFFTQDAPAVGIATTADFADALTGGAHVARRNGPLLLSDASLPEAQLTWVRKSSVSRSVFVYGGETRFADSELARISTK